LVDPVDLGQQLIDDCVVDPWVTGNGSPGLADGVDLVEDDDVETWRAGVF
jgi:hypothetical protein